jgi:hypothetical protein
MSYGTVIARRQLKRDMWNKSKVSNSVPALSKFAGPAGLTLMLYCLIAASTLHANEIPAPATTNLTLESGALSPAALSHAAFAVASPSPMGMTKMQPGPHTTMTGWQLPHGWYFGKQGGEHSGLGFLWQNADDQISLSTKGIRLIRRF